MSKKLFTDRRWTDPPQAKVVGYFEMTEEEKRQDVYKRQKRLYPVST